MTIRTRAAGAALAAWISLGCGASASEGKNLTQDDEIQSCLRTIDANPDPGHSERTPSVACLIAIGRPALVPTLDLLSAASSSTRARAERVVSQITRRIFGFDGTSWSDADRDRWMAWWDEIGYAHDAPANARAAAVARLRQRLVGL